MYATAHLIDSSTTKLLYKTKRLSNTSHFPTFQNYFPTFLNFANTFEHECFIDCSYVHIILGD